MSMTGIVAMGGTRVVPFTAISTATGRAIIQRYQQLGGAAPAAVDGDITREVTMSYDTARGRTAVKDAAEASLLEAANLVREQNFLLDAGPPRALAADGREVHPCDASARRWNSAGFVMRSGFFRGSPAYYEALAALDGAIAERGAPQTARQACELLLRAAAECSDTPPEPEAPRNTLQYQFVA